MLDPALIMLADGRFPAGGHANSCGTESAVVHGDVRDNVTLHRFVHGRLATTGTTDAAFAARACAAVAGGDRMALERLDAEYDARTASPYLRDVSRTLGRQLCRTGRRVFPHQAWTTLGTTTQRCHHPIALGAAVVSAGGAPADAAVLAMHHLVSAVVTAAVRLLGLDPIEVAAVQSSLTPAVAAHALDAPVWAASDPADLPGMTSTMMEILGEMHGRSEARLFVA